MKLLIDKVDIPENDPYKNDLFNFQKFGKNLTNLVSLIDNNAVICVNANWGEGKTTFAKMWKTDLENDNKNIIYYDAFLNDYIEDPLISFIYEIRKLMEKMGIQEQLLKDYKKIASKVIKGILSLSINVALKIKTKGLVEKSFFSNSWNSIKSIFKNLDIENRYKIYDEEQKYIKAFGDILEKISESVYEKQGFPLVIIIDELDRCKPDYALSFLERIKHFFSKGKISFVLLTYKSQLESYIKNIYGNDIKASDYLEKFININLDLPKEIKFIENDYNIYTKSLSNTFNITIDDKNMNYLFYFFREYDFSKREIEKFFIQYKIYLSSSTYKIENLDHIIKFFIIIKIKFPEIFEKICLNLIDVEWIIDELKIKKICYLPGNEICKYLSEDLDSLTEKIGATRRFRAEYNKYITSKKINVKEFLSILSRELFNFDFENE